MKMMIDLYTAATGLCLFLALGLPLVVTLYGVKRGFPNLAYRRFALTGLWILGVSALAASGWLADFSGWPPRPFFVLFPALMTVVYWSFNQKTTPILERVSQRFLIGIQSFRIPVELFLWALFLSGEVPIQMTFEGQNLDIITGCLGAVLYLLWPRLSVFCQRWAALVFNGLGLFLLSNIVLTAILSMPTAMRLFMNEPANRIVTQFPFVLLPTVLVPAALFFHLLSLRKLS
jgi:hypothetical protein